MRKNIKGFLVLSLALTLSSAPAFAADGWLQKIKNFFSRSNEQTVVEQPVPVVKSEQTAETEIKPVFDFSEKIF